MEGHHHLNQQPPPPPPPPQQPPPPPQHHQHPLPDPHHISWIVEAGDRFPQWSAQETRDFLTIRAELDPTFMETKRNKPLWEVTSTKMKEKGYNRSAEQCKCKWKNLVTRYKGCETMEAEGIPQQFPFYNELHAIFGTRMQQPVWTEGEGGSSKKKGVNHSSEEDEENEDSDMVGTGEKGSNKKRKKVEGKSVSNVAGSSSNSGNQGHVHALKMVLEDFVKQQTQMEMEWLKAYEAREEERRKREMEWRQRMEELENERTMMKKRWRELEEQRRVKDEDRAEKRDALITQLLNKLRGE